MDPIKDIVKRMVSAGESEDNIRIVIESYNKKNPSVKKKEEPVSSSTGYTPSVLTETGKQSYQAPEKLIPEAELNYKPNLGLNTQADPLGSSLTQPITTDQQIDNVSNGTPYQQAQSQKLEGQLQSYQNANPDQEIAEARNMGTIDHPTTESTGHKLARRSAFVYNNLLSGLGSLGAGSVDWIMQIPTGQNSGMASTRVNPVDNLMLGEYREEHAPKIREVLVNTIGASMSDEERERYQGEFLTGSIGGLAASIPAMLGGKARGALFFLQSYDSSLQSINQSDVNGQISEQGKTLYATTVGAISAKLENIGFDRIFKGKANGIAQIMAKEVIEEAANKGSKVTSEAISSTVNAKIKDLSTKFLKSGAKVFDGMLTEGATGTAQEIATVGSEGLTNALSGKDIFEIDDFAGITERVLYAGAQEAVGGGFMVGAASLMPTANKVKIKQTEAKIQAIDENLQIEELPDASREVLIQEKIKAENELESENSKAKTNTESLSEENRKKATELSDKIDKLQEVLDDPNVNDVAKASIQQEYDKASSQLDQILENKDIPAENKKAIKVLKDLEIKEEVPTEPAIDKKDKASVTKPDSNQTITDLENGDIVTFLYKKNEDVPSIFKNKISSTSTINGKTEIRVSLPKSEADYLLASSKSTETPTRSTALVANEVNPDRVDLRFSTKGGHVFRGKKIGEDRYEVYAPNNEKSVPMDEESHNDIAARNIFEEGNEFTLGTKAIFTTKPAIIEISKDGKQTVVEKGKVYYNSIPESSVPETTHEPVQKEDIPDSIEPNTPQKPRGIRAVKDTLQKVFGLSPEKADASSKIYDKVMRTIAKRTGKTPTQAYEAVQFVKADADIQQKLKDAKTPKERNSILEGALFQLMGPKGAYATGELATMKMQRAVRMDAKGENPVKIWLETGWQNTNNGWVSEIPDGRIKNASKLIKKLEKPGLFNRRKNIFKAGKLSDFLDNPDLFNGYPHLKKIDVMSFDGGSNQSFIGGYDPKEDVIYLNHKSKHFQAKDIKDKEAAFHSVIVHELQHAIQKAEGFDGGGSLKNVEEQLIDKHTPLAIKEYDQYVKKAIDGNEIVIPFFPFLTNFIVKKENASNFEDAIFKHYQSNAGEVQSRNAQFRMNLADPIRKNTPPSVTEDIPANEQTKSKLLFQEVKGAVQLYENGEAIIRALTDPDVSTPMHELAHIYEQYLTPEEIITIENWSNQKSGSTEFSESFAEGFEAYLQEGKAPDSKLQTIFDKFKEWLNEIYEGVARKDLNKPMQKVYDAMLGFEPKPLTRTEQALSNDPRDWREAVLQRLLSKSAISTKSFINQTGFGWIHEDGDTRRRRKATKSETDDLLKGKGDPKGGRFIMTDELRQAKLKGHVKDDGTPLDLFLQDENNIPFEEGEMMAFTADAILEGKILYQLEAYKPTDNALSEQEAQFQDHLKDVEKLFGNNVDLNKYFSVKEVNNIFEENKYSQLNEIEEKIDRLVEDRIVAQEIADQLEQLANEGVTLDDIINNNPALVTLANKINLDNGRKESNPNTEGQSSTDSNKAKIDTEGERKARVTELEGLANDQRAKVKSLENDVNRLTGKLSNNLKENQADMFGQNKTPSLLDDRADQQKLVDAKKSELKESQDQLKKIETDLEDAKDAVGQFGVFDNAIETLRGLKIDSKGKMHDATIGIPIALYNGAIETAIAVLKLGNSGYRAIQAAKKYLKDNGVSSELIKKFEEDVNAKLTESGVNTQEEGYIQNTEIEVPDFKNDKKKSWSQNFYDNTKSKIKEWFDFRDGLGKQFYEMRERTLGSRNLEVRKASITARKLADLIKKNKSIQQTTVDEALRGSESDINNLPQEAAILVNEMRAHIDSISRSLIDDGYVEGTMIDTIATNLGEYLHRSYRLHDSKNWKLKDIPDNITIKAKQVFYRIKYDEVAESMPDATAKEIQDATIVVVENIVNEMFEEARPSFSKGQNTNAKDTGILKHRNDIPVEVRALMGEYTDPINNYMRTIASLASFHSTSKYLNDVKKAGMGTIFFEKNNQEGKYVKIGNEGTGSLSPLNGLYTTPEMAKAFSEAEKNISPIWRWIMHKSALVKGMKTVYSVSTHIKNIEGNIGFVMVNGHFDISNFKDAGAAFRSEWNGLDDKAFREIITPLIENNVLGQNVITAELRSLIGEDSVDFFSNSIGGSSDNMPVKGTVDKMKKLANKVIKPIKDNAEKAYEMEDAFFKIYGYLNDLNRYSKAMKGEAYNKLSSSDKKEMRDFATELTKNSYATYSRIPEIVKKISKMPFGNFIGFASESYRIAYNSATRAVKEIKSDNPKIRAIGAQRVAGMVAYKGVKYGLMATLGKSGIGGLLGYLFDDDEEEQTRKDALRYVAPWSKNSDILIYPTKDGVMEYFDFSSYDPFGMQESIVNALLRGEDPGDKALRAGLAIIEPFTDEDLFIGIALDLKENKNNYGKNIWEKDDSGPEKLTKQLIYASRAMEPGTVSSVRRMIEKDGKLTDFAYRNYKQDLGVGLRYKIKDANEHIRAATSRYNSVKYKHGENSKELKEAAVRRDKYIEEKLNELQDDYNAALRLGADPAKLKDELKTGRLSVKRRRYILNGKRITKDVVDDH